MTTLPVDDLTVDLNFEDKGPTTICRDLLSTFSPTTKIKFYRGKTLCFVSPTTVGEWASLHVRESENSQHMRFIKTS